MDKELKNLAVPLDGMRKHNLVMVCGATGFIGSHVVAQLLKAGYSNVHIISRTINSCRNIERVLKYYDIEDKFDMLNIHYGTITNYTWLVDIFTGCNIVFDCAASMDVEGSRGERLISDNTTLSHLIGEAAVAAGVDKIVHTSSISVLDAQSYPTMTTEDNHLQTMSKKSIYSKSKFYSENEMWRIAEKGIKLIVVNPAVVLGVGDWHNSSSPKLFKKVASGLNFYSSGIMGYVMVDDVAKAMIQLSECDKAVGERFILCSDNLSFKELFAKIRHSMGHKSPSFRVYNWFIIMFANIINILSKVGFKFKYSKSILVNLVSKHCYDGSKIQNFIEFEYCNMSEKLKDVAKAYREDK